MASKVRSPITSWIILVYWCKYPSKIEWDLTNRPLSKLLESRAIRYSGLGVRSVDTVGDFLENIWNSKSKASIILLMDNSSGWNHVGILEAFIMSTESTGVLWEIFNINASHRLVSVSLKSMSQNTQAWQMDATWKDLKSLEPMGSKKGPFRQCIFKWFQLLVFSCSCSIIKALSPNPIAEIDVLESIGCLGRCIMSSIFWQGLRFDFLLQLQILRYFGETILGILSTPEIKHVWNP